MDERNRLINGRFLHNLNGWTSSGATYNAGDGDEHYGVVVLPVGAFVERAFAVPQARGYSLHLAVKPVTADLSPGQAQAQISDGDGDLVATKDLSGAADTWTELTFTLGLAPGTTYTLRISNVSAAAEIKVDDVWLWWAPKTRAQLAAEVHAKLGRLASGLSTTPSGTLTEGSYTYAVDAGLRTVGAIDPETDTPDVRWLEANLLDTALDAIEKEMLERLQRDYAVEVDVQIGPRRESLSQVNQALSKLTGTGDKQSGGMGSGKIVVRKLHYER